MNTLPSERVAIAAVIAPGALTAGAKNSGWIDASLYSRLMAIISTGTLGASATLDGKFQQADDSAGANAADVSGAALSQILKASGDNKQAILNLDVNRLVTRSKRYVRFVMTVGTATSDATAVVLGFDPRHSPATDADLATVTQTVSV